MFRTEPERILAKPGLCKVCGDGTIHDKDLCDECLDKHLSETILKEIERGNDNEEL